MSLQYSMIIQWSDEDQVYIVHLPEFGPYAQTHGSTYEEAAYGPGSIGTSRGNTPGGRATSARAR